MGVLDQVGGFIKGVGEGAYNGVAGTVHGLGTLASDGYKLATDGQYREQAWNDAVADAQKAANFAGEAVTNPGQAAQDVGNAVQGAYDNFQAAASQAAAQGKSGEFYGDLLGQGAVLAGTALIPGGAEAEGLDAAANAGRLAEGATALTDTARAADAGAALTNAGQADGALAGAADAAGADTGAAALDGAGGGGTGLTGGGAPPASASYPDGLAFRADLPDHLAGPDGFKSGLLNGTHNADNATAALEDRGASQVDSLDPTQPGYTLTDTGTPGISELNYNVENPNTGLLKSGTKTVYDPSVYSDQQMLDLSQEAGSNAFGSYMQDPANASNIIDGQAGGVDFRSYINTDPNTGAPYVGNVHPIAPADSSILGDTGATEGAAAAADPAPTVAAAPALPDPVMIAPLATPLPANDPALTTPPPVIDTPPIDDPATNSDTTLSDPDDFTIGAPMVSDPVISDPGSDDLDAGDLGDLGGAGGGGEFDDAPDMAAD